MPQGNVRYDAARQGQEMMQHLASLEATDLGNGYVNIAGTVVLDGETRCIDYDAPLFMVTALVEAARKEGALT